MSNHKPVEDIPADAVEVRRETDDEVVGWLWHEAASTAVGEHGHWRFATAQDADPGKAYVSPHGFLERRYAFERVAIIKGIARGSLYVAGD